MPEFILNRPSRHRKRANPYYALSTFAKGYLEAMFFTNCDSGDSRENRANELGVERLTHVSIDAIARDCAAFLATPVADGKTVADIIELADDETGYGMDRAGNDFWFTRQGHGVGYWDRDLPDAIGKALTNAAKQFGESYPEIWRGWIHYRSDAPAIDQGN